MTDREEDVQSVSSNLGSMATVQRSLENLRDIVYTWPTDISLETEQSTSHRGAITHLLRTMLSQLKDTNDVENKTECGNEHDDGREFSDKSDSEECKLTFKTYLKFVYPQMKIGTVL
jgi:hypothetical protein